jgi:hypothetical protein
MSNASRLEKLIIDELDVQLGRNSYQACLEETYTSWKHIYHRCPTVVSPTDALLLM